MPYLEDTEENWFGKITVTYDAQRARIQEIKRINKMIQTEVIQNNTGQRTQQKDGQWYK